MVAASILACAINVSPVTMAAIVGVESAANPVAIHVNKLVGPQPRATTAQQAAAIARHYIAAGFTVDLGLIGLNSSNLVRFGYTVEDALDPCKNVAAGGAVLSAFYGQAVHRFGEGQQALQAALSGYNTGSLTAGIASGYVGKYFINATLTEPQIKRALDKQAPPVMPIFTTVAYDRPGFDLRIN